MIPLFDGKAQLAELAPELIPRLGEICLNGQFIMGPSVERFEAAFAAYCQVEHCVACNSGTSALHLALRSLGIGVGDEVITPPMTFVATAWAAQYVGARPVFADIDPVRRTLDPGRLEQAVTSRTKAIVPVHLYGQPADMEPILDVAHRYGLAVVEDAAQAHGAHYRGRRVGGLGDIGCFSFYPTKNLGACGEGGALVTNDRRLADRARMLRDHAQRERYRHETEGYNYRMDAFQGTVLELKLPRLDGWNAARRRLTQRYRQRLADAPEIVARPAGDALEHGSESVEHLFVIESPRRDLLREQLRAAGVDSGLHYPTPVHLQPAFSQLGYGPGDFPASERLAHQCLSLPLYPELSEEAVDAVCDAALGAVHEPVAILA